MRALCLQLNLLFFIICFLGITQLNATGVRRTECNCDPAIRGGVHGIGDLKVEIGYDLLFFSSRNFVNRLDRILARYL